MASVTWNSAECRGITASCEGKLNLLAPPGSRRFSVIHLDMDGVLVDLIGEIMRQFGLRRAQSCLVETYDGAVDVIKSRSQYTWMTNSLLWESVGRDGFARARGYYWAIPLATACIDYGPTMIVTSPLKGAARAESIEGKVAWLRSHGLGQLPVAFCSEKHLLATPESILIDDSEDNIRKYRDAGGTGFLWPAPWNTHDYEMSDSWDAVGRLQAALENGVLI